MGITTMETILFAKAVISRVLLATIQDPIRVLLVIRAILENK
jgi:hypothetical protein